MLDAVAKRKQGGVSLVELMVGIAVALILLTGVLTLMLRVSTQGGETVQDTRLNQELRASMQYITKELQRAGSVDAFDAFDTNNDGVIDTSDDSYTGTDDATAFINALDFSTSVLPVLDLFGTVSLRNLDNSACTTNCPCILYSYDLNNDGLQGVSGTAGTNQNTANFETFGIRHDANNNAIDILTSGTHSCAAGTWTAITSSDVAITNLDFDLVYTDAETAGGDSTVYIISGGSASTDDGTGCTVSVSGSYPDDGDTLCLFRRKVVVELSGQLSGDANVTGAVTTDVKIKNDFLDSQ
jgi:type II secretory pathway pseudopilin PulG